MSQIPQYVHRLRAMWFKASFDEKLDGIKEVTTQQDTTSSAVLINKVKYFVVWCNSPIKSINKS